MQAGDRYGAHRVLTPAGVLPQAADRLDADMSRRFAHEVHVDVNILNVDSASMHQLAGEAGQDAERVGARVLELTRAMGKLQNPVTGSGGMLLGRVSFIGEKAGERFAGQIHLGDRVATLVSLTGTPLALDEIERVDLPRHRVHVRGRAVVFTTGMLVALPDDLPEGLVLGALDVAGAAPQIARLAKPEQAVIVLGVGGKSGLMGAVAARRAVGPRGIVVGMEAYTEAAQDARALGVCDAVVVADATDALAARAAVLAAAPERVAAQGGFDLVVSCVNVAKAESTAILLCRERGRVYFFSMATQFARAALGAEAISADVDLYIGNGYCRDHARHTLDLLRGEPVLRELLSRRLDA